MSEKSKYKVKIKAKNVSKVFKDGRHEIVAIDNFDIEIREGELAVIVGPSGCGKSTFLNMLAGFVKPTSGQLKLNDQPIEKPGRNRGFVFQEFALYPWKTVKKNILMPLEIGNMDDKLANEKADEFIKLVGLEGFSDAYPHNLSGGMKQRVGLARALVYNPEILLLDEPFGSLDAQTRKIMQQELIRIWQEITSQNEKSKTIVFIT